MDSGGASECTATLRMGTLSRSQQGYFGRFTPKVLDGKSRSMIANSHNSI
jgi:hypothetical protein